MKIVKTTGIVLSTAMLMLMGIAGSTAYTEYASAETANLDVYTQKTYPDAEISASLEEMFFNSIDIVTRDQLIELGEKDVECMTKNIYFESGTEAWTGKLAVGRVVLNRVSDSRFPNTVCGVIYEGPTRPSWKDETVEVPIRNRCQFSWYCDGKSDKISERTRGSKNWQDSERAAILILFGEHEGIVEGATHYHANYVSPSWRHDLTFITRIDTHIFYRWE